MGNNQESRLAISFDHIWLPDDGWFFFDNMKRETWISVFDKVNSYQNDRNDEANANSIGDRSIEWSTTVTQTVLNPIKVDMNIYDRSCMLFLLISLWMNALPIAAPTDLPDATVSWTKNNLYWGKRRWNRRDRNFINRNLKPHFING